MGLTLRQVSGYLEAIERQRNADLSAQALAARMAQADGKDWRKYINSLMRG